MGDGDRPDRWRRRTPSPRCTRRVRARRPTPRRRPTAMTPRPGVAAAGAAVVEATPSWRRRRRGGNTDVEATPTSHRQPDRGLSA